MGKIGVEVQQFIYLFGGEAPNITAPCLFVISGQAFSIGHFYIFGSFRWPLPLDFPPHPSPIFPILFVLFCFACDSIRFAWRGFAYLCIFSRCIPCCICICTHICTYVSVSEYAFMCALFRLAIQTAGNHTQATSKATTIKAAT